MDKTSTRWEVLLEELGREFQLRELELSLLHDIDRHLLSNQRPDESLFRDIIRRTGELLGSPRTRIQLKRGQFLENTYSTVESEIGERILVTESMTSRCVTDNVTVNIADLGADAPYRRSIIATPIRLGDEPIGVLSAQSPDPHAFTEIHETIITAVAAQVAIALLQKQSFDVAALFADVDALVFSDDPDSKTVIHAALNRIMEELGRQRLQFSGAQIVFNKGVEELEIVYSTSPLDIGLTLMIEDSICGRAFREKRTIVVADVSREKEYQMLGPAIQSEIAVPILVGAGTRPIAVLNVESEELDVFGGFNKLAVESFANRVSTLLAFAKLRSDVTESLELRSSNDLLAAVGDQASNMIHRLNNTVGAMRFRLKELLAAYHDGTLAIDEDLGESIQALLSLADRTLDMPRRVTQLLSAEESTVEINQCVRQGIDEVGIPPATELRLTLSDQVKIQAPANFDIVVQNLIQNALDAMPSGGVLSITTCLESHPAGRTNHVLLKIKDSGWGIMPEVLPRIFDLKFTTKTGTKKGLGLGLWWVRNFVRRAGGEVTVQSEPGEGTRFVVKIPVRKEVTSADR